MSRKMYKEMKEVRLRATLENEVEGLKEPSV